MIYTIFAELTERLNEYLSAFYDIPEDIVSLGMPVSSGEEPVNKLQLFLLNLERETSMGIGSACRTDTNGRYPRYSPAWNLNLYFAVAAVFDEKRYADSLKLLSGALAFLQQNGTFRIAGSDTFTIEPVTLSMQELTNVWSILGGTYYPSAVCKLRMLTVDGREVKGTVEKITRPDLQLNK